MVIWIVLCGLILFLVNFLLIYFIREKKSFSKFPGIIYILLLFILAGYFASMIGSTVNDINAQGKGKKTLALKIGKERPDSPEEAIAQFHVAQQIAETEKYDKIEKICFVLNLLIIQAVLGVISALVGRRLVPQKRLYYFGFCGLYLVLIYLSASAEYLLKHGQ